MTNTGKRRILAFAVIVGIVLFLFISFVLHLSSQFLLALWLVAHLPFVVVPFYCVFKRSERNRVGFAITFGWVAWLASAILWELAFGLFWERFDWGPPGIPGELLIGMFLGWLPAAIVTCMAGVTRASLDHMLPIEEVYVPSVIRPIRGCKSADVTPSIEE